MYEPKNFELLKKNIEDHIDNFFTKLIYEKTKKFESKGDNFKDIIDAVDAFVKDLLK